MSNELTFLVAFATVYGASEAIKHIQSDARRKEHRSRKNNLIVRCLKSCEYSSILEGRRVVLSGDKLYIDTGTHHAQDFGHPFAGYYLAYPDSNASGLVSTICDEPPIMNWIYVDRWSYEMKFGNRSWADDNFPIPWDCSRQDRRLTFGGWEGFLAVKEGDFWALYFDLDEDHLKSKVAEGTPVLEIELIRVEMRMPKPQPPPPEDKEKADEKADEKAEVAADANGPNSANDANGADAANGANGANGANDANGGVNGHSGPDKADGSTYQKGAYATPPEEPLESPAVD
ncbi:hypothetical protein E0Z10_g8221 [Xylaria hypoxylon]|uniref:Uncharacterized protein n=1 Tax=Xylaria hypoxylon TaxID=37992 RepID=A0A4Z0YPQ6_9PEZI|nr:hypothetical protein E0Z10_g8221 [Xylaria hypoxylon]